MGHEYTAKEVRHKFLTHISSLVTYWDKESRAKSSEDKLDGLAFSILSMLDGSSADLPGFIVAPHVHASDKSYHQERNENWYAENLDTNVKCDIGGSLHEYWHEYRGQNESQRSPDEPGQ